MEEFLRKSARKVLIKLKYDQLNDDFNEQLKGRLDRNRDSVPNMIVIEREDGHRFMVKSDAGEGLKATLSMKKDIEEFTGENTVELLFYIPIEPRSCPLIAAICAESGEIILYDAIEKRCDNLIYF